MRRSVWMCRRHIDALKFVCYSLTWLPCFADCLASWLFDGWSVFGWWVAIFLYSSVFDVWLVPWRASVQGTISITAVYTQCLRDAVRLRLMSGHCCVVFIFIGAWLLSWTSGLDNQGVWTPPCPASDGLPRPTWASFVPAWMPSTLFHVSRNLSVPSWLILCHFSHILVTSLPP